MKDDKAIERTQLSLDSSQTFWVFLFDKCTYVMLLYALLYLYPCFEE